MSQTTTWAVPSAPSGLAMRNTVNTIFDVLRSNSSGASAPSPTVAGMLWFDESVSPPVLRQRNAANTAWNRIIDTADAAASRTALGATAAGAAWFTAADVAAQRTLLGFAETLGFPKRQDVPGSLRQQANTVNTGAGSSVAVTFPFSFSETPLVLAIPIATGGVMLTLASVGSAGFTLQSWASNTVQAPNINCQWFAWAAK